MNELLQKALAAAKAHKAMLIKAGSAVVGAALGATVASVVLANMEDDYPEDFPGTEDEVSE